MHFADFVSGSVAGKRTPGIFSQPEPAWFGRKIASYYNAIIDRGGACGVAVGYPLDTVKVRIQTQKHFTGFYQCAAETLSKEGVHGFFKGMLLPLATVSVTSSVVFGTYRNCLQCLRQARGGDWGANTKMEVFLSGLAGGVAQVSVMSPGDIVKVRLQCQTQSRQRGLQKPGPKYLGPVHCLLHIVREDGLRGLYRGALPLTLRDGPSYATYFLIYTTLYDLLSGSSKKKPHWTGVMLAGGLAGMAGWFVATPMDVVKARLQMDGVQGTQRYRGFVHCFTETLRTEGSGVFFRSLGVNCLRAFPVNMVVFFTYEVLTGFLTSPPENVDSPPWGLE